MQATHDGILFLVIVSDVKCKNLPSLQQGANNTIIEFLASVAAAFLGLVVENGWLTTGLRLAGITVDDDASAPVSKSSFYSSASSDKEDNGEKEVQTGDSEEDEETGHFEEEDYDHDQEERGGESSDGGLPEQPDPICREPVLHGGNGMVGPPLIESGHCADKVNPHA